MDVEKAPAMVRGPTRAIGKNTCVEDLLAVMLTKEVMDGTMSNGSGQNSVEPSSIARRACASSRTRVMIPGRKNRLIAWVGRYTSPDGRAV
jgi:hypothetical protein